MLAMKYNDAAGRTAYLAGSHAAQALISESTGRSVKTHRGVRAEFHRLVRNATRVDDELRNFLGFPYNLRAIADHETGPGSEISAEPATEATEIAKRFVTRTAGLIADG